MNLTPLLFFHITAGGFGLVSGATALLTRKGAWLHRTAGAVFFISMLLMSTAGAILAVLRPAAPALNLIVAAVSIYMVATSWMTIRRKEGETGVFEIGALLWIMAVATGGVIVGMQAANSPKGVDGIPAFLFYGFAGVAALAAFADVSVIARGGVSGAQRIARHLWRMCVALFLASLAFFVGQGAKVFPQAIRETGLLPVPMLIVLALMLFWLARVLLTNWHKKQTP